jgi:hypothetical protein
MATAQRHVLHHTYPTFEGKVVVRWSNVVVLEITVVSAG